MNAAVIVAGGTGERSGLAGGKQLAVVAGLPVLSHTLHAFERCAAIDAIVVVVHPDRIAQYRSAAIDPLRLMKVVAVVGGGERRQDSVEAGLAALPADTDTVAVHDGARPLVTPDVIARAIGSLTADTSLSGVVVGHPSYDTLKTVDADGQVLGTPDRRTLWVAQTPQVFRAGALRDAYRAAAASGFTGTDDASIVEHAGGKVAMVAGPRDNIKITVPEDLLVVERIMESRGNGVRDE